MAQLPEPAQRPMVSRKRGIDRRRVAHRAFLDRLGHAAGDGGRDRARQSAARASGQGSRGLRSGAPPDRGEAGRGRRCERGVVRALCRAHAARAAGFCLELHSEERTHRPRAVAPGSAEVRRRELNAVSNDAGGKLSPARMADRPEKARRALSAPRARERAVAGCRAPSRPGAGRRHRARHPGAGAGRPRHHHRRRDPARKLFQPLRHRARGHRYRPSRQCARPLGSSQSGAAHRRKHPVEVEDLLFLRKNTSRKTKITVPGPFTMSQQAQNDFYKSAEEAAMDYAAAVNEEIRDLFAAGADIVQIDEPYMQARPEKAREYGLKALNRALDGVKGTTAVHICFGYAAIIHSRPSGYSFLPELAACSCRQVSIETAQSRLDCAVLAKLQGKKIMVGCLDLSDMTVETPQQVADRIRKALKFLKKEDVIVAPDCGMKYLPRDVAFGKIKAMVEGAKILRTEVV